MNRAQRFAQSLGRHWRRVAAGALLAWLFVIVSLAWLTLALEARHVRYVYYDLALGQAVLLVVAIPGGALIGYATRRQG